MLLPPNTSVRVLRALEDAPDRSDWITALSSRDWNVGGELFKRSDDGTVIRAMVLSRDVVLKTIPLRGIKGLTQRFTRSTRAHRQWAGCDWLRTAGLQAPRCVALIAGKRNGVHVECLVMDYIPGHTLLWHIARGAINDDPESHASRAVAYAVGRDIARLVKAGRFNRDHKPSNLVVAQAGPPTAQIAIVDAVAIRPLPSKDTGDAIARMLASLMIEPRGIGHPVPPAFMRRVVSAIAHETVDASGVETWTEGMLTRATRLADAHVHAAPKDDPLLATH